MPTNRVWPKIDGGDVVRSLQEVIDKLDTAENEVILDCSSVNRLDPAAIEALEKLAGRADNESVRIVLRGVNVNIYKVLKLVKLAARFSVRN